MSPPNLLFIYTDEQAFNTLATYGNTQIQMPNLNRLANESVVFDECYVTQPVCTPSRSTLLTGMYPHTNGCTENNLPLSSTTHCLPEMISNGDYVTAHHGKWHLGDELFRQHGFQEWISIEDAYNRWFTEGRDRDTRSDYHHFLIKNGFSPQNGIQFGRGEATRLPEEFGKPAFLAQEASRFIHDNKDRPFILYVNFLEPHMPFYGPRDDQYSPDEVPLPPNFENTPSEKQSLKARLLHEHYVHQGNDTEHKWKELISNYWGLCSLVDTYVGKILDSLEENGLRDNTIVVFTSDHGDMMGSHQIVAKCLMYQEAIRVPMMIRLPGQTKGKRVTGPFSQIDIVPTLLDLMKQPIPDYLQGESRRLAIESMESVHFEHDIFVEWNGPNNGLGDVKDEVQYQDWMLEIADAEDIKATCVDSIRTIITADGWKFNCSPMGEHELYNLNIDPHETENLFGNDQYRELISTLVARIKKWQAQAGDTVSLKNLD